MTGFLMFPGQGSQYVGMGDALRRRFPYCDDVFAAVEEASALPIRRLCQEGPEDELRLTVHQQPALLAVSVAMWEVLRREAGGDWLGAAGHSVGEYAALVAAGALPLGAAARLVALRGQAMQRAVPEGRGGMLAVMRVPHEDLEDLCEALGGVLEIANINSPQQLIVAGQTTALQALAAKVKACRGIAKMLPVSAPFHSSLMKPAREELAEEIRQAPWGEPSFPVIPNIAGAFVDAYTPDHLIDQITGSVRWHDTLVAARERGATRFVEVGPQRVLTNLARRAFGTAVETLACDEPATWDRLTT